VTDVYPARELPIEGVSGRLVSEAARKAGAPVRYLPDETAGGRDALDVVEALLRPGDLIVTLGAGDIDDLARRLVASRTRNGGGSHDGDRA
jgi:UDP-N-acetylmuramate--alanine ligase